MKEELEMSFRSLEKLVSDSFSDMKNEPGSKDEIIDLWKNHILSFKSCMYNTSEKYNNKDLFKALTKALTFGK